MYVIHVVLMPHPVSGWAVHVVVGHSVSLCCMYVHGCLLATEGLRGGPAIINTVVVAWCG